MYSWLRPCIVYGIVNPRRSFFTYAATVGSVSQDLRDRLLPQVPADPVEDDEVHVALLAGRVDLLRRDEVHVVGRPGPVALPEQRHDLRELVALLPGDGLVQDAAGGLVGVLGEQQQAGERAAVGR